VTDRPPVDVIDDSAPLPEDPVPTETRPRPSNRKVVIEWAVIVVIAVLASLLVRTFVFQTYFIPSASMEPTLMIGDRIIVNKLSVDFGTIHTGDIVVFKAPPAENCGTPVTDLVKRVIGVPGDTLTSKGNTIYIDGKALKETWSHYEPLGKPIGHVYVKPGHYFVMGDNYPDSCDSRYWGTVPRSDIIGKVFLRIWPIKRFSFL
jgi:signal peptidase I